MLARPYNTLRRMFRRHELLATKFALKAPLLSIFALGFVMLPWFLLLIAVVVAYLLLVPSTVLTGPGWLSALLSPFAGLLAGVALILWCIWLFPWYLRCVQLMFGHRSSTEERKAWLEAHLREIPYE